MVFNVDKRYWSYNAADRTYTAEASEINAWGQSTPQAGVVLDFGAEGCWHDGLMGRRAFQFDHCDYSGDDIAGWWFIEVRGDDGLTPRRVLIIND